jgi:hypothetical protein
VAAAEPAAGLLVSAASEVPLAPGPRLKLRVAAPASSSALSGALSDEDGGAGSDGGEVGAVASARGRSRSERRSQPGLVELDVRGVRWA